MKRITERNYAIFCYVKMYIMQHGYAPSIREICAGVGVKSTSSVQMHIRKLIELGKLETDAPIGTSRALRIPRREKVNTWIPADEPPKTDDYILLSFENFTPPLVGRYEPDGEGGGKFYVGDDMESCISADLYVNAWMPLPEPYGSED